MTRIALAAEDEGHFRVVTKLVDDVLIAEIDWLRDVLDSYQTWQHQEVLESYRTWQGQHDREPWYKYDPDDTRDLRPLTFGDVTIKPQGRIAGQRLKLEAGLWRRVLLLFCHAEPRPDVVVLAHDLDGDPERRAAMEQVRDHLPWPFPIVLATPQPEIEGWIVSGFVATDDEHDRLDVLRRELSFDPTLQSHRLTSHPNDAPRDAKRVLAHLCSDDRERENACLTDHELLRSRGADNWLPELLDEVEHHVVPIFDAAS